MRPVAASPVAESHVAKAHMKRYFLWLPALATALLAGVLWEAIDRDQAKESKVAPAEDDLGFLATETSKADRCRNVSDTKVAGKRLDDSLVCNNREVESSPSLAAQQAIGEAESDVQPNTTERINRGTVLRDPDDADTDALFASTAGESVNIGPLLGDPDDPMTTLVADSGGERSIGIPLGDPEDVGDWLVDPESNNGPSEIGVSIGDPIDNEQFDLEGPIGSLGEKLPDPEET